MLLVVGSGRLTKYFISGLLQNGYPVNRSIANSPFENDSLVNGKVIFSKEFQ